MERISLNGIWQLRGRDQIDGTGEVLVDAQVPGMAQLTLSECGILPGDLFMGENLREMERYERYEWWYERTFEAPADHRRAFLVFRGVDCLAEYFLNGERIGESDNMFIPFEFDVSDKLRNGENTVCVHISSPTEAVHNADCDLYNLGSWTWNKPNNTSIRRAPHSYGWDIMPRAVTAGLWRDVYLEMRDPIRFRQTFFDYRDATCAFFCYDTESDFADFCDVEIEVEGRCGESTFHGRCHTHGSSKGAVKVAINTPKLWWPYGYGEANLYQVTARIYSRGQVVHEQRSRIGIRTVVLDRTKTTDGQNGRFRFLVNGVEIMAKGSNWVPLDAFHCRDRERYSEALALVKDIGCNILRCWGGNVYEDHEFFDFCDENGIMVWQDFAMACATYPENDDFVQKLRREATSVVREYRHHPSIVLWSGDNEVDQVLKGMKVPPSKNRLTREILPDVVRRNDRGRPYLESSPYLDDSLLTEKGLYPPEDHPWGPRDYYKSSFYSENKAHFISETGYHGCPSLSSIRKFITPERVWPYRDNPEWRTHSTDWHGDFDRVMLMERQVRQLFGEVPTDPEDYILASQISQAEADKYFIERARASRPRMSGIIWWNLLDGWPQMSDAVVDYYFEKKLAYRYIKRSQAPFAILFDEIKSWNLRLLAANDTLSWVKGCVKVTDADTDQVIVERSFSARPNATNELCRLPMYYSEQRLLLIEWELEDGTVGYNHYLAGFPAFSLERYRAWLAQGKL